MTREQAIAFFIFSVAAAGTPGPSNVLLTATGAQVGVRRGLPCLLGVGLGMAVMMFLVAFGLGSVILGTSARPQRPPVGRRGVSLLAGVEDRDRPPGRAPRRTRKPVGLHRRGGLSVGQPEVVARVRQRCRNVSRPGGWQRAGAVRGSRARVPARVSSELPALARLRRGPAARPPVRARLPDLQRHDGRAARRVRDPVPLVASPRRAGASVARRRGGALRRAASDRARHARRRRGSSDRAPSRTGRRPARRRPTAPGGGSRAPR